MVCNVNFRGRLDVSNVTANKARWKNIAKMFKEETKGINYESSVFDDQNVLEIYVDRMSRRNRKHDCIDDLTPRVAVLSPNGTEEILSQPDNVIAKILAKHMQFVQKLDESYKNAEEVLGKAYHKVGELLYKKGFNAEYVDDMLSEASAIEIGQKKVLPEYNELRTMTGFKDAEMTHVNYLG